MIQLQKHNVDIIAITETKNKLKITGHKLKVLTVTQQTKGVGKRMGGNWWETDVDGLDIMG